MTEAIFTARRQNMVRNIAQRLAENGYGTDEMVMDAMNKVPRHLFLNKSLWTFAYEDKAYPIDCEQTISMPYTVALETTLLKVKKGEKVLEIGTGSGYQTAVLAEMGANVYTVERHKILFETSKTRLKNMGYTNISYYYGDGFEGIGAECFDKIIVTAGAEEIPQKLMLQINIGGMMVIPVGTQEKMYIYRLTRKNEIDFDCQKYSECSFVPMLHGTDINKK